MTSPPGPPPGPGPRATVDTGRTSGVDGPAGHSGPPGDEKNRDKDETKRRSPGVGAVRDASDDDGGAGGENGNDPVASVEDPLTVALRERDEYLDMVRRVQADFEN